MRGEERFCTTCRAPLPAGAAWCEKCGADSGSVFDGRMPKAKRSFGNAWPLILVLLLAVGGAVWFFRDELPIGRYFPRSLPRTDTGPIRVVGQRPGGARKAPGAKLSEPEAVITLRRYLTTGEVKSECLALASRGSAGGAYTFDAVDSCRDVKLGRWKVDGKTGEVGR